MKVSRISKIAGLSVAGFAVATIAADKVNVGPLMSQVAGFAGAFVGTLVGRRRKALGTDGDGHKREQQAPPG